MMEYISIRVILDDLLAHPLLKDLTFERAVNYTQHFIKIVGVPNEFEEKVETIKIKNYRGVLPCDYYQVNQVRVCKEGTFYYFRGSTDNFHFSEHRHKEGASGELTYKIKGNVIFTSIEEGDIEISYRAIKVDSEGYPMIPENSSFIQALELYIKKQWFTVLFDTGKLNVAILQNTQQEYAWYVAQATSDLVRPTLDQMEAIGNMWTSLLPRVHDHHNGYKNMSDEEHLKLH